MFPVGSYQGMLSTLENRERNRHIDNPITVGILVADYRRTSSRDDIFNYLNQFDKHSGQLIDFYIPGYKIAEENDVYADYYSFKNTNYAFSEVFFDEFIDKLKENNFPYEGKDTLILLEYRGFKLRFNRAMCINLENAVADRLITSPTTFFESIFNYAEKNVDFGSFKTRIVIDGTVKDVIRFVRENWPGLVMTFADIAFR